MFDFKFQISNFEFRISNFEFHTNFKSQTSNPKQISNPKAQISNKAQIPSPKFQTNSKRTRIAGPTNQDVMAAGEKQWRTSKSIIDLFEISDLEFV